ncbi:SWIB domain-containing protein [Artemisia annua]|uniref:SWIB domain-containing protein n=1 Tax=Artemisia annua TaxID=35608 RepID=A0A2U1QPE4_ARTAN|nr:SWIB domain-containing protein [Artemisia annua]
MLFLSVRGDNGNNGLSARAVTYASGSNSAPTGNRFTSSCHLIGGSFAQILPQSVLYTELFEFESRVDAALARKKIDIQDAIKNPPCIQKRLRTYNCKSPMKPNDEPPTWTMKIIGRILEEDMDPEQAGMMQNSSPLYPKFSAFFKKGTILLDQRLYPDNHMILWDSARTPTPHEGFGLRELHHEGINNATNSITMVSVHFATVVFAAIFTIQDALERATTDSNSQVGAIFQVLNTKESPPTYFPTNKFNKYYSGYEDTKYRMPSSGLCTLKEMVCVSLDSSSLEDARLVNYLNLLK